MCLQGVIMKEFERKLKNYIMKEAIFEPGDRILIAVSGGADSVALLRAMYTISAEPECQYDIEVFHVEHGIRGEESVEDARFVENLCVDLDIRCKTIGIDAVSYARENGLSLEESARILRYACMQRFACENKQKLVVAHHGIDNIETMFFQLSRGSGLRGFAGMAPVKKMHHFVDDGEVCSVTVCRPLLFATRAEIISYLSEIEQEYRTDSTNSDVAYDRNRIRHQILPVLQEINPEAYHHIMKSMEMLRPILKQHFEEMDEILNLVMDEDKDLICAKVLALNQEVRQEIMHEWVRYHSTHAKDLGQKHIEALVDLLSKEVGKSISIPGARVVRSYHTLKYVDGTQIQMKEDGIIQWKFDSAITFPEMLPGQSELIDVGTYEMKVMLYSVNELETSEIQELTYTKCFDYDKIQDNIQIRNRMTGDRIAVLKHGSKKLKDYFIDAKIPRELRDGAIVLADEQRILWVVGDRMAEDYKVDKHTKYILKIEFGGIQKDE